MLKHRHILTLLTLILVGAAPDAAAQIVRMNIDTVMCLGDSVFISVGFGAERNVLLARQDASISHPQTTFLPDGEVCDSTLGTCTYRSPITFSAFRSNAFVTSAQDIDFVRLNIEHSYLGDLLIALECPNGQFSALKYCKQKPENCGEDKFDSLWSSEFSGGSQFLGEPVDEHSTDYCNPDAHGNRPGVGWNYCWSENANHNYAQANGMIYDIRNLIYCDRIHFSTTDSTHIADNSHYYRPQQSFDSLIGCPLNGTWSIVIQDSWPIDNGYLFDWELKFLSEILESAMVTSVAIDSVPTTRLNDSTLVVVPPAVTSDTTITYTLHVMLSTDDTIDTTFRVHWQTPFFYSETDTLCQGDTARWTSLSFTTDTLHTIRAARAEGCDSVVTLSYTFMPSYDLHDTFPYCANEPFLYEGIDYGGPATLVMPHQTQYGCDSTVTVHLITIDSAFHLQLQMSTDGLHWSADTVLYGCTPMTVYLRDTTLFEQWRWWDFGDGDTLRQELTHLQDTTSFTHIYDSVGSYSFTLMAQSIHGCVDSTVLHRDAVHVYPVPVADFTWESPFIYLHDPEVQFINLSQPGDSLVYQWHISSGNEGIDTSTDVAPHYTWPVGTNDVSVDLIAIWLFAIDDSLTFSCADTLTKPVDILNDFLQFPNLVTPNGDGVNDRWEIVNLLDGGYFMSAEVWIYDRWGDMVYHCNHFRRPEDFWDPNATRSPDGTYYYRFSARNLSGIVKRNGTIEVLR